MEGRGREKEVAERRKGNGGEENGVAFHFYLLNPP